MRLKTFPLVSGLALVVGLALVEAATSPSADAVQPPAVTDPVGTLAVALRAQSDSCVSIPLWRPARYTGVLQAGAAGNVLTVVGTPGWSVDQFAFAPQSGQHDTFFVLLGANASLPAGGPTPKEGCFYTVVANGTNALTLDLNGDDLSAVQPGTRVTLIPYWTLGTAFPASDAGNSFVAADPNLEMATTIRVASAKETSTTGASGPNSGEGSNSPSLCNFSDGAWRSVTSPNVVRDDDLIFPDSHLVVRNNSTTPLTFRSTGTVLMAKFTVPVSTPEANYALDLPVALPRPVGISLNDLGLINSGALAPAQDASTLTKDTLATYDNAIVGYNKTPTAIYYYAQGAWRKVDGSPAQDYGADMIPAGAGFTLHKGVGDGTTLFWLNSRNYLQN